MASSGSRGYGRAPNTAAPKVGKVHSRSNDPDVKRPTTRGDAESGMPRSTHGQMSGLRPTDDTHPPYKARGREGNSKTPRYTGAIPKQQPSGMNQQVQGNANRPRQQQPRASKHRWSRTDLRYASRSELQTRVTTLEAELEEIRRKLNSTGRSDATTNSGRRATLGTMSGQQRLNPSRPSSMPSVRSSEPGPYGMSNASVPPADPAQSARRPTRSNLSLGNSSRSAPSIVTFARPSTPDPVSPGITPPPSERVSALTSTAPLPAAVPEAHKRDAPRFAGVSLEATKAAGPLKENEKAIKAHELGVVSKHIMPRVEKRAVKNSPYVLADNELVYYLKSEIAFRPMTIETLPELMGKAKKYLRNHDCTNFTAKQQYEICMAGVIGALSVDETMQTCRQSFKNEDLMLQIEKHNRFLETGFAGNSGVIACTTSSLKKLGNVFGPTPTLPKKNKT